MSVFQVAAFSACWQDITRVEEFSAKVSAVQFPAEYAFIKFLDVGDGEILVEQFETSGLVKDFCL